MQTPELPPLTSRPPLPKICQKCPERWDRQSGRLDKRTALQMRPLFVRTGVCKAAVGSCFYSQDGGPRIFCSVFGPKPTHSKLRAKLNQRLAGEQGNLLVEVTFTTFSAPGRGRVTRSGGGSGQPIRSNEELKTEEEARLSNSLVETFQNVVLTETFPNSCLEICISVLGSCGSGLTAATINCVSMALADATVPMRDLCTAISVGVYSNPAKHNNKTMPSDDLAVVKNVDDYFERTGNGSDAMIIIDPVDIELVEYDGASVGHVTIALCPLTSTVAYLDAPNAGDADLCIITAAFQAAESACSRLGQIFREHLRVSIVKSKAGVEVEEKMIDDWVKLAAVQKMKSSDVDDAAALVL